MNVIDWMRASAEFMVKDRPDVYDMETAVEELSVAIESLREIDAQPVTVLSFTSYVLVRIVEDDAEEFILSRKLAGVTLFGAEEECSVYAYSNHVNLPDVLDEADDLC